ncbi:DNA cytosine methyltransferase [Neptunomonas antarctica]|uniref:Cytosine-specific methyltransferase n=1 Tax=Neptunomonas antarctica TaxID=619304 RepID=A0A1N7IVW0_9GAMM|nr:DNA cytosine methyltransferase [Neptunomonas antarctica]SIS41219.1 DNA (cytosine-5)-methyltransferase 1 [Neptunomonas antarctica]
MNHIELFSGCGGLSLGLERAGFELTFANELSPMAGETFAYNLLGEDLDKLAKLGEKSDKVYWISSQFDDLNRRLRENPFEYPELACGVTDIPDDPDLLKGKLLIGNIIHLNSLLESRPQLLEAVKCGFGNNGVDLVSGGPPCQSFSLAGLRKKDCDKNSLPWEFAKFVGMVQPKFAVLENVTGILRAFKEGGVSYHAWFEVAKAFAGRGYIPLCLHINARLAGIPQNRPRFIMIGVREDVYQSISASFCEAEKALFSQCIDLFQKTKSGKVVDINNYHCFDAKEGKDAELFRNSFLSSLIDQEEVSVKKAIHDLRLNNKSKKSDFVNKLNNQFESVLGEAVSIANHGLRNNSNLVKRRFRIYQVIQKCSLDMGKQIFSILKGESSSLCDATWNVLKNHEYVSEEGGYIKFKTKVDFINYLLRHPTKKRTQRALDAFEPAPAALSIPDDACHYDDNELRTLTVREMARIQSFPDAFIFRSKVTTGGKMRRFEVPQYTQVGNAVPPLLGLKLGNSILDLLNRLPT